MTIVTGSFTLFHCSNLMAQSNELSLKIVRPTPGESLTIREGSTFVIGTVSPPQASLTVNGAAADVSSDGAFVAFAPIQKLAEAESTRKSANAVFQFVLRTGDKELRKKIAVALPPTQKPKEPSVEILAKPVLCQIKNEQVLSRTASSNWGLLHLPIGAYVIVDARRGKEMRLRLTGTQETWLNEDELDRSPPAWKETTVACLIDNPGETQIHVGDPVPYTIQQIVSPSGLRVTLYLPDGTAWHSEIQNLDSRPWGFSSEFQGEVLTIRQRPAPDLRDGLKGKIICLDPGHNPDPGAIGPRGLEEREANLRIGLALEKMLMAAGAKVVFTHRHEPLPLRERRRVSIQLNPDLFVSLHNNSLPDGRDPRTNYGTSTFYYHPQSKPFADAVHAAMLKELGFPDQKVQQKSLFVCRISEFPAILVEPAYIILPEQEKLLLSEAGQQKIAKAIFDGLEGFFLQPR